MPQLELHDFAPQLIWLTINFIALYVIMARVALPRIATVIEERRDRIASDLDRAAQLKQETDEAIAAYEEALANAKARAFSIAQEKRQKLADEVEAEKSEAQKQIADRLEAAEKRIEDAKNGAMSKVNEVAAGAAESIIQELIGAKTTKAEVKQAVSKALPN
jgi:F-type H+-transporting ATPase subunit b